MAKNSSSAGKPAPARSGTPRGLEMHQAPENAAGWKADAASERPLTELERRLLGLGGDAVNRQAHDDPHAAQLLERGQVFDLPVRMKRGEPHGCHGNSAGLWGEDVRRHRLVTGYGLSGGRWVQHSWVLGDRVIYETTIRFERYFGAVLTDDEAAHFWFANYLPQRYPGPFAVMMGGGKKG